MLIIVDEADKDILLKYNWWITKNGNIYYAKATINNKQVYLHRFLLGAEREFVVDHLNGNGLDNTRANLKLVSHSENLHNGHNRKRLKGVSMKRGLFCASFREPNKGTKVYLGGHLTEELAGKAYDNYVRANYPQFAYLCNFKKE